MQSQLSASADTASALAQLPVWRANQMARYRTPTQPTGFPDLDAELPDGGWPRSALVELCVQQSGIGEMQLLKPTLVTLTRSQRVALIRPPYAPQTAACRTWGVSAERLLWAKAKSSSDALWTAEQILKNGSCGAVVLWQTNIRSESLRRLNLAAQGADTWFWLVRPISCRQDASPAPLRLALRPASGGVAVEIIKRRGPHCDVTLQVRLPDMPSCRHLEEFEHAILAQRESAAATVGSHSTALV